MARQLLSALWPVSSCPHYGPSALIQSGEMAFFLLKMRRGNILSKLYSDIYFNQEILDSNTSFTGRGTDIILDPIGGSNSEKNMKSIGIDGRWVLYGLMGGAKVDGPFLAGLLRKRVQLLSSTLRARPISVSIYQYLACMYACWYGCMYAFACFCRYPDINPLDNHPPGNHPFRSP